MVTSYQAEMAFALQGLKASNSYLNLTGGVAGSLTHIGFGHGHLGHFLFTDATTGKQYAAAANPDGNIYVKSSQWAANIPNYAVDTTKLSDDLADVALGNVSALFASISGQLSSNKDLPFTAVTGGTSIAIGGAILSGSNGGLKNTIGGPSPTPNLNNPAPQKWVMPAIIAGVVLVLGGLAYWAFKGR